MIQVRNMRFRYGKNALLFDSVNFELPVGHIVGLLGKNGAGKTTLLKLLSGLSFPGDGEIRNGEFVPGERFLSFLQNIFFLTEETWLPGLDAHGLIRLYAPLYPGFDEGQFYTSLKTFDVPGDRNLNRLSYGQKKKALIAFALAANTRYLFFDEPTNGLDIPSKSSFRSMLAASATEERTIIISTHQVRDLQHMIDWVMILDEGRIMVNRSLNDISDRLSFGQALSIPPADALFSFPGEMGTLFIRSNPMANPGNVDLETFFTGVLEAPERVLPNLQEDLS